MNQNILELILNKPELVTFYTFRMFLFLFYRAKFLLPNLDEQLKVGTPKFVFAYYPRMQQKIEAFEEFESKHADDKNISTLAVNCIKHRTYCAKYHYYPGRLYISIFDHEKPTEYNDEFNAKTLDNLYNISIGHGYVKISTEEEVSQYANQNPLFLFVTRSNAGDLQQKKPVFARVASHNIGKNLIFGYVTSPILYEKYAKYPYNAFVYVSPSGKYLSFRGNFDQENLEFFIKQHSQPVLGDPITKEKSIVVVGNEQFYDRAQIELADFQTVTPIVYINSTQNKDKASYFCDGKYQCVSIVDFATAALVPCGTDINIQTIQTNIVTFDTIWNGYPLFKRLYTSITVSYNLHPTDYYVLAAILVIPILYIVFYVFDAVRILY